MTSVLTAPITTTITSSRPDVTLKLSQLQNLCKRDPQGHRTDYDLQILRLRSECQILSLNPSVKPSTQLSELIQFAAAVSSSCYDINTSNSVARLLVSLLLGKSYDENDQEDEENNQISTKPSSSTIYLGHNYWKNLDGLSLPASALSLHKDVRKSCVSALILMRNKGKLPPLQLLELFYRVMAVIPDKGLREQLYKHIVNDIRNINKNNKRDEKVNRNVQAFLHKVVGFTCMSNNNNKSGRNDTAGNGLTDVDDATKFATKRAVDMVAELYRRKVWTDERTVAIMATAVESRIPSVSAAAMRFFLNIEEKMANDEEKEKNDEWYGVQEINYHAHSRKTKVSLLGIKVYHLYSSSLNFLHSSYHLTTTTKYHFKARERQVAKQVKNKIKAQKKRELGLDTTDHGVEASKKLYPAIELLRDPQGLAESILKRIQTTGANGFRFEHKLLAMNFVTRLVGNHELILLNLYPFLRRYMGGNQRDVTAVLAYSVQACHELVPPEEVHGLLQTIAHNFITERCSGEQIAVGINTCRAICARVPSSLVKEDSDTLNAEINGRTSAVHVDVEAFARDLAGYAKHRDRSVAVAGRSWQNFVREVYPSLLQGKDRGAKGSALHRAGEKPLRYGEKRVAAGVRGADLLVEYEAKKEAYNRRKAEKRARGEESSEDEDSDDGIDYSPMNDGDEWEEVEGEDDGNEESDVGNEDENEEEVDEENSFEEDEDIIEEDSDVDEDADDVDDDEEDESVDNDVGEGYDMDSKEEDYDEVAPNLVEVKEVNGKMVPVDAKQEPKSSEESVIDLSKMSAEERQKLAMKVSATRIFTAEDFAKMRKLVEREERIKRDPRAAARLKRLRAQGKDFEELSDDSDIDSDEEEGVRVKGAVDVMDIAAEAKRKRASKIERLEKIIAGREEFEHKKREGGSTNNEKKRRKNFLMSKFSLSNREKQSSKETARRGTLKKSKKRVNDKHASKKRRRKL